MADFVRLFRLEPYRTQFTARLLDATPYGERPAAVLEATCFYPTAGGQPHDTGTLAPCRDDKNPVRVVEVLAEDDGRIVHLLDRPLAANVGDMLQGAIDWARRFDHMQQHTGQHLLSAAFERVLGAATTSFHLSEEVSTIDLDVSALTPEQVEAVEDAANDVVYRNLPVEVAEYTDEEVARLPLRKPPAVHGLVRIVSVRDVDWSACGGTHVRATGEVGVIHVRGVQRSRGGVRVEFQCGRRALLALRALDASAQALAGSLSVSVADLGDAVARLAEAERAARHEAETLRRDLLAYRLEEYAAAAESFPCGRLVCRVLEGLDAGAMRYVAGALTQRPGMVVLLAVTEPSVQLLFGRAEDAPGDMGALLREVLAAHGGRGGGRPHSAQGGGVPAEALGEILAAARERVIGG